MLTSVSDVALHFECSWQTNHNMKTRYASTGSVTDRSRSGSSRATSCRENRFITLKHLRNRFTPATVTAQRPRISDEKISNRLRQNRAPIRATQNGVNVFLWLAVSPDKTPIEHMWGELGTRVRNNAIIIKPTSSMTRELASLLNGRTYPMMSLAVSQIP
jgi:hypothetical protein